MRNASWVTRRALVPLSVLVLPLVTLAGCNKLLDVQAPSRVAVDVLDRPSSAGLLVDGARAAFGCAYQAYIMGNALLTDEMDDTQLAAAAWDWDRRSWNGSLGQAYAESPCDASQIFGTYRPLQTARFSADDAANRLAAFSDADVPGRAALQAQANLLAGYNRIMLGEGFCTMAIDNGPEITQTDVFTQAEQYFTDAITFASSAGNSALGNAAKVGRARARLDLARVPGQAVNNQRYTDAMSDASQVPAGFEYDMAYNPNSSYSRNNISARNRNFLQYGIGVNYRNLNDPRVVVTNSGQTGADAVSIVWLTDKYPSQSSPIVLASYKEAQLIVAEAQLFTSSPAAAVTTLDALRGRAGVALPPYSGTVDAASVQAFLLSERSKELFLEGQHFWDIARFNLPLDPPAGTVYPGKGGNYGDLRCLPLPDIERINNPNIGG
jgi:starch-binding outer membrane protein, SusD/RagB family